MTLVAVATASVDPALTSRINLALIAKAYSRVDNVANGEDQRELNACFKVINGVAPTTWHTVVLLVLDNQGTLATATDAEIQTAVNAAWNRVKVLP